MIARFGLLGDVTATVDGAPVPLGHARQRSVLAALLVDVNRPVSVDRLIGRVWGDHPPQRARDTLYGYLYRLRRALGAVPDAGIMRNSGGYLLAVDQMAVDLHRFRALARQARTASAAEDRLTLFDEALALWRGDAFDGLDAPWLITVRAELDREKLEAELERADVALGLGRHDEVLTDVPRRVAAHPTNERMIGQVMRALHHSGRSAEALEQFRRLRTDLVEELGIEPALPLQELHQSILLSGTAAAALPAEPATPLPRQLPMPPRSFIGRSDELAQLDATQTPGTTMAVVISGPGGIGKTWLALHWAHTQLDRFPDGQLFVNLRGFDPAESPMSPVTAIRGFLDALGVVPAAVPTQPESQVGLYRSLVAGRRMLIVLDNARDAQQVRLLLPGSPDCAVLVTSRSQLSGLVATDGFRPLSLGPLSTTEAHHLLARRLGETRIREEPAGANHVVHACGGIPLALSIVAVRAVVRPYLSLQDLAHALADRHEFDALGNSDDAADLRSVFSASYRALTGPSATLFRRLTLYPGPDVSTPAAASLAGLTVQQLRKPLDELLDAHVLTATAPGRYTCHDLLRAYGAELLGEAERAAALRRLIDHYLHTAHSAAMMIEPHRDEVGLPAAATGVTAAAPADAAQASQWFARERTALLTVARLASAAGLDGHAWRLAWALATYLSRSSRWTDLAAIQRTALAAAVAAGDLDGQAHSHRDLALALQQLARPHDAMHHLRRAAELYGQLGDRAGQAYASLYLGWLYERQGRQGEALTCDNHALALFTEAGHTVGQAKALNAVGWDLAQLDDHQGAIIHCRQALALHEALGNRTGAAKTWDSLGYAHHRLGDLDEARACYQAAFELYEQTDDGYGRAETLTHLGDLAHDAGDLEKARENWSRALSGLGDDSPVEASHLRRKLGLAD